MHFHVDIACFDYFVYLAILTVESFFTKGSLTFHLISKTVYLYQIKGFIFLMKFLFFERKYLYQINGFVFLIKYCLSRTYE